jgi:hypothetical protein
MLSTVPSPIAIAVTTLKRGCLNAPCVTFRIGRLPKSHVLVSEPFRLNVLFYTQIRDGTRRRFSPHVQQMHVHHDGSRALCIQRKPLIPIDSSVFALWRASLYCQIELSKMEFQYP